MVQEARGLDAGPRLVNKLQGFGDHRSAGIVAQIAQEERAHVAVGVYWFHYYCRERGLVGAAAQREEFQRVARQYALDIRGPFEQQTRELVGLQGNWYQHQHQEQGRQGFKSKTKR